jgi:chromosomal replication initiator protein
LIAIPLAPPSANRADRGVAEVALLVHDFYAGPENRLIAAVLTGDASLLDRGNPLLLTGPAGAGKSSLAWTLARAELARLGSSGRCLFELAHEFARRHAESIEADDREHFRQRYLRPDVLVIDDVHHLAGKPAAQDELSSLVDQRVAEGRVVITTCPRLPTIIRGIRANLASRLLPGLTIPIHLPGAAARRRIVEAIVGEMRLGLSAAQLDRLIEQLPSDLSARRLAATIQQVVAWQAAHADTRLDDVNLDRVTDSLRQGQQPSMAVITSAVAKRFQIRPAELKGATRRQAVVRARSLAMFLGRRLTESSLQDIGSFFGGRDHTTVMHACRQTERLLATNTELARAADELLEQLRAG